MSDKGPKELDSRWTSQVTDEMKAEVAAKAVDGKLTCPVLRKYAEETGISYKIAGAAADMQGIKVHNCDLGCF